MRIFIGCSSKEDLEMKYQHVASEISSLMRQKEIVIGGSMVGLMRLVSEQIPKEQITQVYLKDYLEEGITNFERVFVCDTIFSRMQEIWNLSDCFLILPGGSGTLSELFSFLEENRTKQKKKAIFVLNYDGFYDDVVSFIHDLQFKQFVDESVWDGIFFPKTPCEFIELLEKEVQE